MCVCSHGDHLMEWKTLKIDVVVAAAEKYLGARDFSAD